MKKVPWRILFVRELLSFYISKKPSLKNILLSLLMWTESIFVLYINEYINEVHQKLRYNLFWYQIPTTYSRSPSLHNREDYRTH
jgi:hypothetical protein